MTAEIVPTVTRTFNFSAVRVLQFRDGLGALETTRKTGDKMARDVCILKFGEAFHYHKGSEHGRKSLVSLAMINLLAAHSLPGCPMEVVVIGLVFSNSNFFGNLMLFC